MAKKFISVQNKKTIHKLFEKDIWKIYYIQKKNTPTIPKFSLSYDCKFEKNEDKHLILLNEQINC